ncbi:MAG: hypothetical protein ABI852_03800 [Gemmatimonadaceae bacterium]
MKFKFRVIGFFCSVALCAGDSLAASAQDTSSKSSNRNCWRGRPQPACDAFLLTEVNFFRSVINPSGKYSTTYLIDGVSQTYVYELHPSEWKFSTEVGGMVNRGKSTAVGGTLLLDVGPDGASIGLKARYRRWLTPEGIALDFGAGVRTTREEIFNDYSYVNQDNFVYQRPRQSIGFTTDVAINASDYVAVVSRLDINRYDKRLQPTISLGVRAESRPAVFALGGIGLTYGVLVLLFLSFADD